MKTNVVMKSADRELFGIVIKQNTKVLNGALSVTDLQKAYERARFKFGWSEQNITSLMNGIKFRERLYHLLLERDFIKLEISSFMKMIEKEGMVRILKGLGVWKTTGKGDNKSTYCDPYIWVLLAMELNPKIYAKVVMWLTDSLIIDRCLAGSNFHLMTDAIKRVVPNADYSEYFRKMNIKIFGRHERGIRQSATAEQLRQIAEIETFVAQCVGFGMCKNETQLLHIINNYNLSINQLAA